MSEIVFPSPLLDSLRTGLSYDGQERCAVILATRASEGQNNRLLAREVIWPTDEDYTRRGPLEAELRPEFVAQTTSLARREQVSVVFAHSHPGLEPPNFSRIDDQGETRLRDFLSHRTPGLPHAAMVCSSGGMRARLLGEGRPLDIVSVGSDLVRYQADAPTLSIEGQFDRQVRAFGSAGQMLLNRLRVGIVGLGGMGSLIGQQLAHLGVRDFVLVDPDHLETTNLNRVSDAGPDDVGRPKVAVCERYIHRVARGSVVRAVQGDITRVAIARELLDRDLLFGCTDSHGSRAIIQQIAYQYLIPCIDTGTVIVASGGKIKHIIGRVQLLAPGLACLTCGNLLDPGEIRRDMMNEAERKLDPYLQGAREPAPAVMSINATAASLAITMTLSIVCGAPAEGRHLLYDGRAGSLRKIEVIPQPDCIICSMRGAYAKGSSWPLWGRMD